MSDTPYVREQIARIRQAQTETEEFVAEQLKAALKALLG